MNPRLARPTSVVLAAFYAVMAACGHGLHCHADHCVGAARAESVAAGDSCSCGHAHTAVASASQSDANGSQQWRAANLGSDGHECAACQVLEQLGVGYASQAGELLLQCHAEVAAIAYEAPSGAAWREAWSARGPPSQASA